MFEANKYYYLYPINRLLKYYVKVLSKEVDTTIMSGPFPFLPSVCSSINHQKQLIINMA